MKEQSHDHAGVAFHPPVMMVALVLAGIGLRRLVPLAFVPRSVENPLGYAVAGVAFALAFWAMITMRRGGASVPTHTPTTAIVGRGPYRFSRNPIYVSLVLLLVAVGIVVNSLWFVGLAVVAMFLLSWGVISREEAYLERQFGADYLSYKARVRRWL